MKIHIIAVGKMKDKHQLALMADYTKRLRWDITIKELAQSTKAQEAIHITKALPPNVPFVALDEHGQNLTSRKLASHIQTCQENEGALAFVIGGADGLDKSLLQQAKITLAFGKITLPHMFARIVLIEQIYRSYSLLNNHPYHRD